MIPIPHTAIIDETSTAPVRLSILGATGSIGTTAFQLIDHAPEHFQLEAITAQDNVEQLIGLAKKYRPAFVAIGNAAHSQALKEGLAGTGIAFGAGQEALLDAASRPAYTVLSAIVGSAGLAPTLAAIRNGSRIALANKECLVCAGDLMLAEVAKHNGKLLPVDSEHSAIYQVFDSAHPETVEAIVLTASGGPFRTRSLEEMAEMTPEQALHHPNWSMGAKITIDSATLMNKGLELIEAYHLFPVKEEQIEVIVHPESIIHSMVRYRDGSTLAQMGAPSMMTPIAYALSHPVRMHAPAPAMNLTQMGKLTFEAPDETRFPALRLAREALKTGGDAPIIFNAANEISVQAFLEKRIGFLDIARTVERMLNARPSQAVKTLEDVQEADASARARTMEIL